MLKIWGRATSVNVQKVMWAIAELGVAHERIDAGGAFGGLDTPEYRAMNPNGLIPTLQDAGAVVWESHAIVRYLAATYGRGTLWSDDPATRAQADMWMDWMHTAVLPDFTSVFFGLVRTAPSKRDMPGVTAAAERLGNTYATLEKVLTGRAFLTGDTLSMGDIPLGSSLYRYFNMDISRPALPNVEAWYARLQERAAYREHVMVSYDSLRVSD